MPVVIVHTHIVRPPAHFNWKHNIYSRKKQVSKMHMQKCLEMVADGNSACISASQECIHVIIRL